MSNEDAIKWLDEHFIGNLEVKALATKALESIDHIAAERDAAVEDLKHVYSRYGNCHLCKHGKERMEFDCMHKCERCDMVIDCQSATDCWEWRGVQNDSI